MTLERDFEQKLWRDCRRCPQCDTIVSIAGERVKCVRCGCTWDVGVDRQGALIYALIFLPLGIICPVVLFQLDIHAVVRTHGYGLMGIALECCFWLTSVLLLLGGIVGVAALFNWGRFRPRLLTKGMVSLPTKEPANSQ